MNDPPVAVPAVVGLHHVRSPVSDLMRSRDWYTGVLGFEPRLSLQEEDHVVGVVLAQSNGLTLGLHYARSRLPLLVNVMPVGEYLMEDFFEAGGIPAVMAELADLLDGGAMTVSGWPMREPWPGRETWNRDVIRPLGDPLIPEAGLAVLRGNLCPQGAIVKSAAASTDLMVHTGPALVFDSIEDFKERVDDPDLDVDRDTVMVLRGCGPKGYPRMPEVGNLPLPAKLLAQGVEDMVRISDARMGGTAFGTTVLHVAPESTGRPVGARPHR